MHSGALFASYFNGNHQYPTLRLTDRPSIAVWRSFVAASRAGKPAPGPTPSGTPSPFPSPVPSPSSSGSPPSGVHVAGLALTPASVSPGAEASATVTFSMSQLANVTVCVLNASGKIVRTVSRPARPAGQVTVSYLRFRLLSHRLPAGTYRVLVVASNRHSSAARSAALTVRP